MSSGKSFILGSKGQRLRSQVCAGLQTERSITAAAYASHAGFLRCNAPPRKISNDIASCGPCEITELLRGLAAVKPCDCSTF